MKAVLKESTMVNVLSQISVGSTLQFSAKDLGLITAAIYPGAQFQYLTTLPPNSTEVNQFVVSEYEFDGVSEAKVALRLTGEDTPAFWICEPTGELGTGIILGNKPATIILNSLQGDLVTIAAPLSSPDCGGNVIIDQKDDVTFLNYCSIADPAHLARFTVEVLNATNPGA